MSGRLHAGRIDARMCGRRERRSPNRELAHSQRGFYPTGKTPCAASTDLPTLSSPIRKNILVFRSANHRYIHPVLSHHEGRWPTSLTRGRMRWTQGALQDEQRFLADVRSRVVLTPRRWCQVCEKERRRRWPTSPEHRGEHDIAVKTIAWGMPGDSGVTCMLVCALPLPLHTRPRAHRAPGIPCALNSERAGHRSKTRGVCAGEIANSCPAVIARSSCDEAIHSSLAAFAAANGLLRLRSQ